MAISGLGSKLPTAPRAPDKHKFQNLHFTPLPDARSSVERNIVTGITLKGVNLVLQEGNRKLILKQVGDDSEGNIVYKGFEKVDPTYNGRNGVTVKVKKTVCKGDKTVAFEVTWQVGGDRTRKFEAKRP